MGLVQVPVHVSKLGVMDTYQRFSLLPFPGGSLCLFHHVYGQFFWCLHKHQPCPSNGVGGLPQVIMCLLGDTYQHVNHPGGKVSYNTLVQGHFQYHENRYIPAVHPRYSHSYILLY